MDYCATPPILCDQHGWFQHGERGFHQSAPHLQVSRVGGRNPIGKVPRELEQDVGKIYVARPNFALHAVHRFAHQRFENVRAKRLARFGQEQMARPPRRGGGLGVRLPSLEGGAFAVKLVQLHIPEQFSTIH